MIDDINDFSRDELRYLANSYRDMINANPHRQEVTIYLTKRLINICEKLAIYDMDIGQQGYWWDLLSHLYSALYSGVPFNVYLPEPFLECALGNTAKTAEYIQMLQRIVNSSR